MIFYNIFRYILLVVFRVFLYILSYKLSAMDSENNYLSVGFWNINGLSEEKSANDIHQIYINNFDLIFLLETWKSKTYINKFNT